MLCKRLPEGNMISWMVCWFLLNWRSGGGCCLGKTNFATALFLGELQGLQNWSSHPLSVILFFLCFSGEDWALGMWFSLFFEGGPLKFSDSKRRLGKVASVNPWISTKGLAVQSLHRLGLSYGSFCWMDPGLNSKRSHPVALCGAEAKKKKKLKKKRKGGVWALDMINCS